MRDNGRCDIPPAKPRVERYSVLNVVNPKSERTRKCKYNNTKSMYGDFLGSPHGTTTEVFISRGSFGNTAFKL